MSKDNMSRTSLHVAFERWRRKHGRGWGLAWYLATELCRRFYESHGIVPHVCDHEGLGYYGILVEKLPCPVNGRGDNTLGRFTMHGDVENWIADGPGGHGLELIERAQRGEPVQPMVAECIRHFGLPPFPGRRTCTAGTSGGGLRTSCCSTSPPSSPCATRGESVSGITNSTPAGWAGSLTPNTT